MQLWQLVGVRIKGDIAELLFDHLEILPIVGLKRFVFHGPKTWPEFSAATPAGTTVRCHLPNIFWHTVPVAAIYRKRRKLSPALRQFIDFLKLPEPGEKV
jgi:hypothetical protein